MNKPKIINDDAETINSPFFLGIVVCCPTEIQLLEC